jgi:hypothetical protein
MYRAKDSIKIEISKKKIMKGKGREGEEGKIPQTQTSYWW